jgi:chloramphenicol 3-O-phosphotransferase
MQAVGRLRRSISAFFDLSAGRQTSATSTRSNTVHRRSGAAEASEVLDEATYCPFEDELDSLLGDDLEEGKDVGGAEDEICEITGYEMEDAMRFNIAVPFVEEERIRAYEAAGFMRAQPSDNPQAVWLIGPSASGKSTLAPISAEWVGIVEEGFVEVDGEYFRDSHGGYQDALRKGAQLGCVWWGAYTGIRENVNIEKQEMLQRAADQRKHLVIPSTCLRKSQCVDVAEMLLERGYTLHIVGIYGEKEEITRRGRNRAMKKGKRYNPNEFGLALRMFGPMLRRCNGRYRTICSTAKDPFAPVTSGEGPLAEEDSRRICAKIFESYAGKEQQREMAAVLPSGHSGQDDGALRAHLLSH